ncbi:MAG: rhodanese-like domain-containing protein [Ignavibacteriales bacterium]|nr:rhodanese-like domain-containing protein [Ignavibacteriales bacterium]
MTRFKQALREAGILILVAGALGLIYTSATQKGLFARGPRSKPALRADVPAPSMISRDEARSLFESGAATFIDTRHNFDYDLGHIKGAINVPLKDYDLKKAALSEIPKARILIAYCDGAECNSSIELSVKLMKDGYRNVKIFFGGWREWVDAKLPVEKRP